MDAEAAETPEPSAADPEDGPSEAEAGGEDGAPQPFWLSAILKKEGEGTGSGDVGQQG